MGRALCQSFVECEMDRLTSLRPKYVAYMTIARILRAGYKSASGPCFAFLISCCQPPVLPQTFHREFPSARPPRRL
jgi:hypothetical protein